MNLRFLLFAAVLFMLLDAGVVSCESVVIESDVQHAYALELFDAGDYISSVVELKRFIRFFPDDERVSSARYTIGLCWMKGGRFSEALKVFEEIMNRIPEDRYAVEACFSAVKCHEKTGNSLLGAVALQNLIRNSKDNEVKNRACYNLALLYIDNGSFNSALQILKTMDERSEKIYPVGRIIVELDKTDDIPRKNPLIAGTLALVPGAGYLYMERPRDAFVSFLINGGLIFSAVRSFKREDYALGGVVSFVGFGFYAGSIHGSVASAHKYNRAHTRRFIENLKKELQIKVSLVSPAQSGTGIFIDLDF